MSVKSTICRKPAKPEPLSEETLMAAMVALKVSVRTLFRLRRGNSVLRKDLKGDIAALRAVSRCYFATTVFAEGRAA